MRRKKKKVATAKSVEEKVKKVRKSALSEVDKIRAKLGHLTLDWQPNAWLDTGFPDLNEVLGHRDLGVCFGRIIEISGLPSQGKTALAMTLAALGQRDEAEVLWGDLESSWFDEWAKIRGLDPTRTHLFQPYVGRFGKEKKPRLITAQELLEEMEETAGVLHEKGAKKIIMVVDSIASMLVDAEASGGLSNATLHTKMALPVFMGSLLRRWVGLAQAHNILILFVNQLRQNPMQKFGDPWYTPGGNAPSFYCHVRCRVRRVKGSRIIQKNKVLGIKGLIKNVKNKVGGAENSAVGFKLFFKAPIEFVSVKEIEETESVE